MTIFDDEIATRSILAERYSAGLPHSIQPPSLGQDRTSVWAQYTVRLDNRDAIQQALQAVGIPTMIYYRNPLHTQVPYANFPKAPKGLPVTDRLARSVLSLPMHPYLDFSAQDRILEAIDRAIAA